MENSPYFKELFFYIIDNDLEKVENFLKNNHDLLEKYKFDNLPAVVALQNKRLDIYKTLLSYGIKLQKLDDIKNMTEHLSFEEKCTVRDIHSIHAKVSVPDTLSFFSTRSKLSTFTSDDERRKFNAAVLDAYEDLYTIEEVKPILEAVANAESFNIQFDLEQRSIIFMDPTTNENTLGMVYYRSGDTFIGAEGLTQDDNKRYEATGVLAHELTHYALNLTYNNSCKPYTREDSEKCKRLDDILEICNEIRLQGKKKEDIVDSVFRSYAPKYHHAEIIVRPPQLIVHYRTRSEEQQCKDAYPELFNFYSEVLEEIRKELPLMAARKLLNEKCEVLSKLKQSFKKLHVETSLYETASTVKSMLIKSNCPALTINTIYHETMYNYQHGITSIFIKLENVSNNDLFELMKKTYRLIAKPKFIIDCDDHETPSIHKIAHKLANYNFDERLIFVVHESFNEKEFPMKVDTIEVKHQWKDLTDDYKKELSQKSVTFQGKEITLGEIVGSRNFQSIPRKMLTHIRIASEIFPEKIEFYVARKYVPENSTNTGFATDDLQIEYNSHDLLKVTENLKTIFIEGNAKYGKSIEMKSLAKMLKEKYPEKWIFFIDFKSLEKFIRHIGHSIKDVLRFLLKEDPSHDEFSMEIFMHLFDSNRVIFVLDEIDEVFSVQKTFILNFVQSIRQQSENQIWIAVRKPVSKEMAPIMQAKVFILKPFVRKNLPEIYAYFLPNVKDSQKTKNDIETFLTSLEMFDFIHPGIFEIIMVFLKSNSSSDLKKGNVNLDFLELKGKLFLKIICCLIQNIFQDKSKKL